MNRIDELIKLAGKKDDLIAKYPNLSKEIEEISSQTQPKYLEWSVKQLAKGHSILDIIPTVNSFHQRSGNLEIKDINQYKDLKDLEDQIKNVELKPTKSQEKKLTKSDAKKIYEDQNVVIVRPDSKDACISYGKNTKWCITMKSQPFYEQYAGSGVVFYFILRKQPLNDPFDKIAYVYQSESFENKQYKLTDIFDSLDQQITENDVINNVGDYKQIIEQNLPDAPEPLIKKIKEGTATDKELKDYWNVLSDEEKIRVLNIIPNKYKLPIEYIIQNVDKLLNNEDYYIRVETVRRLPQEYIIQNVEKLLNNESGSARAETMKKLPQEYIIQNADKLLNDESGSVRLETVNKLPQEYIIQNADKLLNDESGYVRLETVRRLPQEYIIQNVDKLLNDESSYVREETVNKLPQEYIIQNADKLLNDESGSVRNYVQQILNNRKQANRKNELIKLNKNDPLDELIKLAGKKDDLIKKHPHLSKEIEEISKQILPKYLDWSVKQLVNKHSVLDIIPTVNAFNQRVGTLKIKDINQYNDLKDLENLIKGIELKPSKTQEKKLLKSNAKTIYEDDNVVIMRPDSKDACISYGKNTKWCITMQNASHYETYAGSGVVFYFILRKNPLGDNFDKVAYVYQSTNFDKKEYRLMEIRNAADELLSDTAVMHNVGNFKGIIEADLPTAPEPVIKKLKEGTATEKEFLEYWNAIKRESSFEVLRIIDKKYLTLVQNELIQMFENGDVNNLLILLPQEYIIQNVEKLLNSKDIDVRFFTVLKLPPKYIIQNAEKLLNDESSSVREETVRILPQEYIIQNVDKLLNDEDYYIREETVKKLPQEYIIQNVDKLLNDEDYYIREETVKKLPQEYIVQNADKLLNDKNIDVRYSTVRSLPQEYIIQNAEKLLRDEDGDVRRLVKSRLTGAAYAPLFPPKTAKPNLLNELRGLCKQFKLIGQDEMADKISCALSALAGTKAPKSELSYSYIIRKLRKGNQDRKWKFQKVFKEIFEKAIAEELENPEQIALMSAIKAINYAG